MTIEQKQCLLKFFGCYDGIIDGDWGALSAAGTKKLQQRLGIPDDGVWGIQTDVAARKAIGESRDLITPEEEAVVPEAGTFWDEIEYFTREEFRCPCGACGGFPVEPEEALVRAADKMRKAFGTAIIIVPPDGHSGGSGVRCQAYNDSLSGSVSNSRHVLGKAIDFSAPGKAAAEVEAYLQQLQSAGTIRYWYRISSGSWHMDIL